MEFKTMLIEKIYKITLACLIIFGGGFAFKSNLNSIIHLLELGNSFLDKAIVLSEKKEAIDKTLEITSNLKSSMKDAKVASKQFQNATKEAKEVAEVVKDGKTIKVQTDIKESLDGALVDADKIIQKNFSDERIDEIQKKFESSADYASSKIRQTIKENPVNIKVSGNVDGDIHAISANNSTNDSTDINTNDNKIISVINNYLSHNQ
jgi:hypothetical protein